MSAARRPRFEELARIVDRFAGVRVAVLGDLVCDEFVHGDIARVSREAPVLILEHARTEIVPGGGANAVANLRALDARPVPVGIVGRDEAGHRLLARFREAGIAVSGVRRQAGYGTPTKSRILAGGVHTRRQQIVRVDRGARHGDLPRDVADALAARLRAALRGARALLVADYGYGAATPAILRSATGRAGRPAVPVTVDSRGRIGAFRRVTACTPNQEELENAVGVRALRTDAALFRAGAALLRRTGNASVLVTRGAQGMCLFRKGEDPLAIAASGSGEVADVTGAGDTVIAVFTLALAAGAGPDGAARLANYAAGLVVMKYGTATVSRSELLEAVREDLRP